MTPTLLYLIGPPGVGKSTAMAALLERLGANDDPGDVRVKLGSGLTITRHHNERADLVAAQLGAIRPGHPGTDTLPMNVLPKAVAWIGSDDASAFPLIVGEGDRLAHPKLWAAAEEAGRRVIVASLELDEAACQGRRDARGTTQNAGWVAGRVTRSRNLARDWAGVEAVDASQSPPQVAECLAALLTPATRQAPPQPRQQPKNGRRSGKAGRARIHPSLAGLAVDVADLTLHPDNARVHDLDALAASLESHGQYRPIVTNRRTGHILAGNGTYRAATERLGWPQIATTFVDVDPHHERRIVAVDNRIQELGGYNDVELLELLRTMPDLDGTGYDQAFLDALDRSLATVELPPTPEDLGESVRRSEERYHLTESRQLVLVLLGPHYEALCADLDKLRTVPDEPLSQVVLRLLEEAS